MWRRVAERFQTALDGFPWTPHISAEDYVTIKCAGRSDIPTAKAADKCLKTLVDALGLEPRTR